jgi:hypothetical protein
MQSEQQSSETLNVSGGEVEKNSFDRNNAPIIKDSSGSVVINYNYSIDAQKHPHCDLSANRDGSTNTTPQENQLRSSQIISIQDKLNNLRNQKRELEKRLECIESEISRIEIALQSETNPSLAALLHWLSSGKNLAEKYGKIALRGFQDLRREAEAKGRLDDFYFEIENYLELIFFSLKYGDKIFLQESDISPTFADLDIYQNASSDAYKEVLRILKENIPKDNIETSLRSKLEDHFDELLERLQAYF